MRDEVERLITAWKRERPDLDLTPLAVLSRISRISRQLDLVRKDAFADLETWDFDVLAALRRAGEPYQLSPSQLMQETMVTSGTITNRLDRLEELELITRAQDPKDGRGSLVKLTRAGMRAVDTALEELLTHEREILNILSREEKTQLAQLLSLLAADLDEGKNN
ncbi:MAG: MarR family transcriptional regulator [Actinobacteria bacterium]|nr:MarR family transcriptional regulator [Actinomycetota bacterium]